MGSSQEHLDRLNEVLREFRLTPKDCAAVLRLATTQMFSWRRNGVPIRKAYIKHRIDLVHAAMQCIKPSHRGYIGGEFAHRMVGVRLDLIEALASADSVEDVLKVYRVVKPDIEAIEQYRRERAKLVESLTH